MPDRFDYLLVSPRDFAASLAFYRDVLGWTVLATWDEGGKGATLSGGGVKVILAERSPASPTTTRVHLDIHDVDARFKSIPAGNHVVVPPETTARGTRWFVLSDPDGNQIAFEEPHRRG